MRHELAATIGGQDETIAVTPIGGGRFALVVGGRALEVDAVEVRPGTWSIVLDGRSHVVALAPGVDGVAVVASGGGAAPADATVALEDARRARLRRATAAGRPRVKGEQIRAPIAGRVVKLLVAVGDEVAPGQGVVVLEAMKMENEIRAERGGTVTTIEVEPGRSVETSSLLLVLA
jgi:biotin carboxyl carrier protein